MVTTRLLIAFAAVPVFVGVIVAMRRGREELALWLLALGSALATLWAGLSVLWARNFESALPTDVYLALTVTGGLTAYYFARTAIDRYRGAR